MTVLLGILATVFCLSGAGAVYLTSPGQRLLMSPLPLTMGALIAGGGLVLAMICLLQISGPAASVFIALTLTMIAWSILPFPIALLQRPKGGRR